MAKRTKGQKLSEVTKMRISNTLKTIYADPIMRAKIPKRKNCRLTTTQKLQIGIASKQHWQDPTYREKVVITASKAVRTAKHRKLMSEIVKQRYQENPELRERIRKASLLRWQNEDYKARVLAKINKARMIRPTKPELILQALLNKHFPQFQYNGDYRLETVLNGQVPDFINANGKKEVIEMFGDYWHSSKRIKKSGNWKASELGKTMAYNALGYKCLIIWENELNNLQAVIEKIRRWQNGKR